MNDKEWLVNMAQSVGLLQGARQALRQVGGLIETAFITTPAEAVGLKENSAEIWKQFWALCEGVDDSIETITDEVKHRTADGVDEGEI